MAGRIAQNESEQFTTIGKVARDLGIGVRQIRRAVCAGKIPAYGIGSWKRVRVADVDRWIDSLRLQRAPKEGA